MGDFGWVLGKGSSPRGQLGTGRGSLGKQSQDQPARVQGALGQYSQPYGETLWDGALLEDGHNGPCVSLTAQDILCFCEYFTI